MAAASSSFCVSDVCCAVVAEIAVCRDRLEKHGSLRIAFFMSDLVGANVS